MRLWLVVRALVFSTKDKAEDVSQMVVVMPDEHGVLRPVKSVTRKTARITDGGLVSVQDVIVLEVK
jgi:hypothetical protein